MCGVIGYVPPPEESRHREGEMLCFSIFRKLMTESRVRGTHAYGLARLGYVRRSFDLEDVADDFDPNESTVAHCRYSTSGDWRTLTNNQPIVIGQLALAFNGVIHMGTREEFERDLDVRCVTDNDGEIFLRKMDHRLDRDHRASVAADFISTMTGSFAGVWLDGAKLFAGRNARRPLWTAVRGGAIWYTSTKNIMVRAGFAADDVFQVPVGVWS